MLSEFQNYQPQYNTLFSEYQPNFDIGLELGSWGVRIAQSVQQWAVG